MTNVQRGMGWLALLLGAASAALIGAAFVLWSNGDAALAKAARLKTLAARSEVVLEHRDQLRRNAEGIDGAYVLAASAAQAEAQLREELSHILREAGGEVSSIRTQPRERGDDENLLRLQLVLTAPQSALEGVLGTLALNDPTIAANAADIRLATGIRRPGAASENEKRLSLTIAVSALWKEAGNGA